MKSIGRRAFYECSGLKSVTIGNGLRAIGEEAFRGCDNVTLINYAGTKKQWRQIEKNKDWAYGVICGEVYCEDGAVKIWTGMAALNDRMTVLYNEIVLLGE